VIVLALATVLGFAEADPGASGRPRLVVNAVGTTDGHVQLEFEASPPEAEGVQFQLEESDSLAFEQPLLRYEGAEEGSFVSGLPAGMHHYRLRQRADQDATWGPWCDPVVVTIDPHSLRTAWLLFGGGGVLVSCILGFLLLADRRVRREAS